MRRSRDASSSWINVLVMAEISQIPFPNIYSPDKISETFELRSVDSRKSGFIVEKLQSKEVFSP